MLCDLKIILFQRSDLTAQRCHLVLFEQPLFAKDIGVDKQRILRKGRNRAVGRGIAVRHVKGQHLPDGKSAVRQEIGKGIGMLAEGAAAKIARKAGNMQKYAGFSHNNSLKMIVLLSF